MQKNNKKSIIFRSDEVKSFCDTLIQMKSKKTGISIMRLIEDALIAEFGFINPKFTDWCLRYCDGGAGATYMSLAGMFDDNGDVFELYRLLCLAIGSPVDNPKVMEHPAVQQAKKQITDEPGGVSAIRAVERIFKSLDRNDLNSVLYDFTYANSKALDKNPVQIDDIAVLLLNIDGRGSNG